MGKWFVIDLRVGGVYIVKLLYKNRCVLREREGESEREVSLFCFVLFLFSFFFVIIFWNLR